MKLQRILIYSGGALGSWALEDIQPGDVFVGADRGALFLIQHGITPHYALGDFDSVDESELAIITNSSIQFLSCDPVMKDLSDTELAFNWALSQHPREIIMLGVTGTRLDHTLGNIQLLVKALQNHISCSIVDANNRIQLISQSISLPKLAHFSHVSLIPFTSLVTGITLQGFQYPLIEATLTIGQSLGLSNRLIAPLGRIIMEQGMLLVIESKD